MSELRDHLGHLDAEGVHAVGDLDVKAFWKKQENLSLLFQTNMTPLYWTNLMKALAEGDNLDGISYSLAAILWYVRPRDLVSEILISELFENSILHEREYYEKYFSRRQSEHCNAESLTWNEKIIYLKIKRPLKTWKTYLSTTFIKIDRWHCYLWVTAKQTDMTFNERS